MGKWANDLVLDAGLDVIAAANLMIAINGQPATFAAAQAGKLADVAMGPADFAKAEGDVSGRKVTMAEKAGVAVDVAGVADHVALLDTANSRLLYVTTTDAPQPLPLPGTLTFEPWTVEIGDPV